MPRLPALLPFLLVLVAGVLAGIGFAAPQPVMIGTAPTEDSPVVMVTGRVDYRDGGWWTVP